MSVSTLRPADTRREALFGDPMLTGDLLLIALAWDHLISSKHRTLLGEEFLTQTGLNKEHVRTVLARDVPHYKPPARPSRCGHVGPRGGQCPQRVASYQALHDPDDGTITWCGSCRLLTHRAWADHLIQQHKTVVGVRVPPRPVYNTRSVLAHHFPELDFPEWWARLTASRWEEARYDPARDPDRGGSHLVQRPRLRIVSS